jgi:hypothetical protein
MVCRSFGFCAWAGLLLVGAVAGCGSSDNGAVASSDTAADSGGGREDVMDSSVLGSTDAGANDGDASQDATMTDSGDLVESGSLEASADSPPGDAFLGFDATVDGDVGAPDGGDSGTPGSGCVRGLGGGYVITPDGVFLVRESDPQSEWPSVTTSDGHALDHVVSVARSDVFLFALRDDGTVWCWSDGNPPVAYGQLGNGTTGYPASWLVATQVQTGPGTYLTGIASLMTQAFNSETVCAVDTSGKLWCWGATNASSQPGALINTVSPSTAAQPYATTIAKSATPGDLLTNVLQVAVGPSQICVILTSGQVECWGRNAAGALGTATADGGSPDDSSYPVPVVGLPSAPAPTQIVANEDAICALIGGEVYCWGSPHDDATGQPPAFACAGISVPCSLPGSPVLQALSDGGQGAPLTGVTSINLDSDSGCAIGPGGALNCWGALPAGDVIGAEPPHLGIGDAAAPSNVKYMDGTTEVTESGDLYYAFTDNLGVVTCH